MNGLNTSMKALNCWSENSFTQIMNLFFDSKSSVFQQTGVTD